MTTRRLRTVTAPACPDTLSDDWITGWQACREVLHDECQHAYERGLTDAGRRPEGEWLGWCLIVTAFSVVAFVLGVWIA